MAQFQHGQRVKRIHSAPRRGLSVVPVGAVGTVEDPCNALGVVEVRWDRAWPGATQSRPGCTCVFPWTIAPLTDPKADEFIERVKSWKPEPVLPKPEELPTLEEVMDYYRSIE